MKFGKKPAVHTPRRQRAMLVLGAHLDALGTPPTQTYNRAAPRTRIGPNWYAMDDNDRYGCCVPTDSANAVTLMTANVGGPIIQPTAADVLGMYAAVAGFQPGPPPVNDDGCDENTAIAYLKATGMCGQKIDDAAPIDITNLDHLKWAIALFFGVRLGICVDATYIRAFEDNQPWTAAMPPGNEGHDVRMLDYVPNGVYVGTWARDDQLIPWDKVAQPGFIDEAHAELWFDVIRAAGKAPNGMSLDQLDADLRAIGPEELRYTQNVTP